MYASYLNLVQYCLEILVDYIEIQNTATRDVPLGVAQEIKREIISHRPNDT